MKYAQISSACECQAKLFADLNESRFVLRGWANDLRRKQASAAPAHAIHSNSPKFQVAWLCPFCNRNTLRSFDSAGLAWRLAPSQPEEAAEATQPAS